MSLIETTLVRPLAGLRVLAVDDIEDTRDLLVILLGLNGAKVVAVASAREALAVFDREPPDVLLSDINMPVETGYDLIRLIRERPRERGGKVPAIAVTALVYSEDRVELLASGFDAHLRKPVEYDELIEVIKAVTGNA
jgi:CheY-like chemotaxis protein